MAKRKPAKRKTAKRKTAKRKTPKRKTAKRKTAKRKRAGRTSRTYGPTAAKKVERAVHEFKRGELKSGGSGKTVESRKQAIAIGLSEARRKGAKVPRRRGKR